MDAAPISRDHPRVGIPPPARERRRHMTEPGESPETESEEGAATPEDDETTEDESTE
jgi:hypothetical protein